MFGEMSDIRFRIFDLDSNSTTTIGCQFEGEQYRSKYSIQIGILSNQYSRQLSRATARGSQSTPHEHVLSWSLARQIGPPAGDRQGGIAFTFLCSRVRARGRD
jgi:hypothetical protein